MENTIENALNHIADSGIGGEIRHESTGVYRLSFDTEKLAASFVAYADQSCSAKDAEIAELKRLNESNDVAIHEREVMIQAFKVIREAFESREWITQGRGCYKYNDDRYMEEAKYLFNDFKKIESEMWRQIKSKSYEYKKSIESPLLSKLAELKRRVAELAADRNDLHDRLFKALDMLG